MESLKRETYMDKHKKRVGSCSAKIFVKFQHSYMGKDMDRLMDTQTDDKDS